MYTEGYEGLEEAERESHRTYAAGSQDVEQLLRENEMLRKLLEKEQFFNKLLDQEIQELKIANPNANKPYHSDYWNGKKRISRSTFYTLLLITLAMAAYIGYGIYYNKQFNYLGLRNSPILQSLTQNNTAGAGTNKQPSESISPSTTTNRAQQTNSTTNNTAQPKTTPDASASLPAAKENITAPGYVPPVVKDSVPNIIGSKKAGAPTEKQKATTDKQKAEVVPNPDEEYNEEEVNAVIKDLPPAPPSDNRPVIGHYKVTSKANFYNSPDENNMRNTFISETGNKTVDALEDKNGFIFVVYTNDLGYTSRGWLSKKDLTKID